VNKEFWHGLDVRHSFVLFCFVIIIIGSETAGAF
jgi:hypothetical protein